MLAFFIGMESDQIAVGVDSCELRRSPVRRDGTTRVCGMEHSRAGHLGVKVVDLVHGDAAAGCAAGSERVFQLSSSAAHKWISTSSRVSLAKVGSVYRVVKPNARTYISTAVSMSRTGSAGTTFDMPIGNTNADEPE